MPIKNSLKVRIGTKTLAALAWKAMITEVDLSPKPGLVDSLDSGAHRDMDKNLFHLSAVAIRPYFEEMAKKTPSNLPASHVLPMIRPIGIQAEEAMFRATGGINTHKGQIFSLGVALAAAVRVLESGSRGPCPGSEILMEAGRICQGMTHELEKPSPSGRASHGEGVYRKLKSTGVRGEAEAGFPGVRLRALPRMKKLLKKGVSHDLASLDVLIRLYEITEDSTVLHRRGRKGLSLMKSSARSFISAGGIEMTNGVDHLKTMNTLFVKENISPGGCADMLALTLLVKSIEEEVVKARDD